MIVRFTQDHDVHDHHQAVIESFRAGQVVDFKHRPGSAEFFIGLGKAEEVEGEPAAETEAAPNPKKDELEKKDAPSSSKGPKGGDASDADGAHNPGKGKGGSSSGGSKL